MKDRDKNSSRWFLTFLGNFHIQTICILIIKKGFVWSVFDMRMRSCCSRLHLGEKSNDRFLSFCIFLLICITFHREESTLRWPLCDCLISFHSSEFPLHKAIEYVSLRKPYVINDLNRQYDLVGANGAYLEKKIYLSQMRNSW